jgi:hypothetical protein
VRLSFVSGSGLAAVGVSSADICCAWTQATQHVAGEDASTRSSTPITEVAAGSGPAKKGPEASAISGQQWDAGALEVSVKGLHLTASSSCKYFAWPGYRLVRYVCMHVWPSFHCRGLFVSILPPCRCRRSSTLPMWVQPWRQSRTACGAAPASGKHCKAGSWLKVETSNSAPLQQGMDS